ncbi:MAG: hypothetical protein RLZZ592_2399 [Pseudomonadota bacterium]|jgi:predicted Zn finger-like uncharacterized protein
MSLATSCPSCGTVFRVQQDQLKTSEGWVRCGQCQEVFNALEGLFDLDRRETTSGASTRHAPHDLARPRTPSDPNDPAWAETRPAMFSGTKTPRPTAPPPPSARAPAPPPAQVRISARSMGTWDPTVQDSGMSMAPTQPDSGSWRLLRDPQDPSRPLEEANDSLLMPSQPEPEPGEDHGYPATTLEFRSEAFSAFASARLQRQQGRPDVDLSMPEAPAPAPRPVTSMTLPPEPPPRPEPIIEAPRATDPVVTRHAWPEPESSAWAPVAVDPPAPEPFEQTLDLSREAAETAPAAFEPEAVPFPGAFQRGEEAGAPPTERQVSEPQGSALAVAEALTDDLAPLPASPVATPGFIRQADSHARWQRPWVRSALKVSAVLLGTSLGMQMMLHGRDAAGARWPVLAPVLETLCRCQLQPPRQLDALVVDSTTLTRPPGAASFVLGVMLHNRADHIVAAPHMELSLTDTRGQVVLRRVLSPEDFRQPDRLQAQADATWTLEFRSSDSRISGYTLAAFYP